MGFRVFIEINWNAGSAPPRIEPGQAGNESSGHRKERDGVAGARCPALNPRQPVHRGEAGRQQEQNDRVHLTGDESGRKRQRANVQRRRPDQCHQRASLPARGAASRTVSSNLKDQDGQPILIDRTLSTPRESATALMSLLQREPSEVFDVASWLSGVLAVDEATEAAL